MRQRSRFALTWLVAVAAVAGRCGKSPRPEADRPPLTWTVICVPPDGNANSVPARAERANAFEKWANEAFHRPGSTFAVLVTGSSRESWWRLFQVGVPTAWGPNVLSSKAVFRRVAEERATAAQELPPEQMILPEGGLHIDAGNGDERVLVVSAESPQIQVRPWIHKNGRFEPLHERVVCDRSDSGLSLACSSERVLGFFDGWAAATFDKAGSTFTVFVPGSSRDTARKAFTVTVPSLSLGENAAYLLSARHELLKALGKDGLPNASAIAEAIHVAAAEGNELHGRHRLTVLSDMRQVTPGKWNFERTTPDPQKFVEWLEGGDLLADLHATQLTVCGLHHRRGPGAPPFDARLAARIQRAWEAAFGAMKVKKLKLLSSCDGGALTLPEEEP